MGMDLGKKTFSAKPAGKLIAGTMHISTAVEKAGEDIKAHAPVALVEGVIKLVTATNVDKIYGIAPEAAKKDEETPVYLSGEFFAEGLELESGVTASTVKLPFRNIGIYLK